MVCEVQRGGVAQGRGGDQAPPIVLQVVSLCAAALVGGAMRYLAASRQLHMARYTLGAGVPTWVTYCLYCSGNVHQFRGGAVGG